VNVEWVRTYEKDLDYIESIGGVMWGDGPLPYPWHRCEPQTRGWMGLNYTERCNCGAIRLSTRGPWMERNSTRQDRKRRRREAKMPRVQVTCLDCGSTYEAIEGSRQAAGRMCTTCWGDKFVKGEV
jgi:hypothetical protein